MQNGIRDFLAILKQNKLDAFIVTDPVNIFYLAGFKGLSPTEREAILIFNPKVYPSKSGSAGRSGAHLVTARLYQHEALALKSPALDIKIAHERNEIFKFFEDLLKNNQRVGFEEGNLTFLEHKNIKKLTRAKLIPFRDLVETQRMVKQEDEIKKIEKAQIISQKAFNEIIKTLKVGQTELEIGHNLQSIIQNLNGGQGLAFESIIASGPNSGQPHYTTGKRKIKANEVLLFDFGAKYQNYCADLSRTVFMGKAKDEHKNIFYHVLNAQKAAISKIENGICAHDAHELALSVFRDHKLHNYFLHGLGHGIGLEVHEKPHLHPAPQLPSKIKPPQEEILEENMVFSVEPGLYFSWGGVRIEDLVVIKGGKTKVLGRTQEDLIEI